MKGKTILLPCLPLVAFLLFVTGCGAGPEPVTKSAFLLDTSVTITIYDGGGQRELEESLDLCRRLEGLFSRTDPESEVYRLNHSSGRPVEVDPQLATLLEKAVYYSELTGGVYDVTVCPVVDLWNFKADNPSVPDPGELRAALELVGYQNIRIREETAQLLDGAQVDLGSIAKGYIADRIAQYLREAGVRSAIINLGGNVLTVGGKPDGQPFSIGVQKPFEPREQIVGAVQAVDLAVVSSGVYERCFTLDGELYHHLLDPATGYPVRNSLLQVTVLCGNSADADALSTACFLLGLERGMELLESIDGAQGIFLTDQGVYTTSGLEGGALFTPEQ